jgi:transposase
LRPTQKERLRRVLLGGARAAGHPTELWTLKRIGTLIEKEFGVRYSPVGAWKLLRDGLNWSWQKPERRAHASATRRPSHTGRRPRGRI